MSSTSAVELHRRTIDAFNRRDFDTVLEVADPEIEFVPFNLELEGAAAYHGHEGILSWVDAYLMVFPDFRVEVDELRDLGEATLAHARLIGRVGESEATFEQPVWQLALWRDRNCVWWQSYRSEKEALEALRERV